MDKPQRPIQVLLWFAVVWGLLLVLLGWVDPIVTFAGPQQGMGAIQYSGWVGPLPATGFLAASLLTFWLLAFGQHAPSRASLTLAEGITGLVVIGGLLALVFFNFSGLLVIPLAGSLVAATITSEVLRQSAQTR
jgi:hypothetical protein